eukprot:CAMPEP_0203745170 /NCGR_PEP_ID=MMETSP0098-20131031/996_1 /ASSEMBLY_ACC=CAM_ASM_000208 /TAXON_ID=96639 /ORGANISM=" , Strain NY0313808BC1" /LENGTH=764 /DNA_ID=CAMNT_0050632879 /DNA_START=174 /DNA_END=2468 /DNA_ORIENTATION=-
MRPYGAESSGDLGDSVIESQQDEPVEEDEEQQRSFWDRCACCACKCFKVVEFTQHHAYMLLIFTINATFVIVGILFPVGIMNMIIVGLPHYRDTMFVLIRIFFCNFVTQNPTAKNNPAGEKLRHVIAVIPAYKEDPEEVELTVKSIGDQIEENLVNIGMIIVSDGFLDYHEIIDDLEPLITFDYTTYKRKDNKCTLYVGLYNGVKVMVAKKHKNAGKKDSLIIMDDILVKPDTHLPHVKKAILDVWGIDDLQYMFHTDADSVISENTFKRMSNIMMCNKKIAAVSGLVLVPFEGFRKTGFWNLFQGFQYYYGQVIRKATESMWGKTTCIPGCINMMNIKDPAVIEACERYNKLPSADFIFQMKNRLQGTDRRYTNCVMQYSKDTYLVLDMESYCYTIPPQSFNHFRSQRKRWTSNAITGNFFLIFGKNIPFYTRFLCFVDIFRIHTSVTRFINTCMLMANISQITMAQIYMIIVVLVVPYLYFVFTILHRRKYGFFLLVGSWVSKVASPFITIYIFLYAMWHFNDVNWGVSHGSQPVGEAVAQPEAVTVVVDGDKPKEDVKTTADPSCVDALNEGSKDKIQVQVDEGSKDKIQVEIDDDTSATPGPPSAENSPTGSKSSKNCRSDDGTESDEEELPISFIMPGSKRNIASNETVENTDEIEMVERTSRDTPKTKETADSREGSDESTTIVESLDQEVPSENINSALKRTASNFSATGSDGESERERSNSDRGFEPDDETPREVRRKPTATKSMDDVEVTFEFTV